MPLHCGRVLQWLYVASGLLWTPVSLGSNMGTAAGCSLSYMWQLQEPWIRTAHMQKMGLTWPGLSKSPLKRWEEALAASLLLPTDQCTGALWGPITGILSLDLTPRSVSTPSLGISNPSSSKPNPFFLVFGRKYLRTSAGKSFPSCLLTVSSGPLPWALFIPCEAPGEWQYKIPKFMCPKVPTDPQMVTGASFPHKTR